MESSQYFWNLTLPLVFGPENSFRFSEILFLDDILLRVGAGGTRGAPCFPNDLE